MIRWLFDLIVPSEAVEFPADFIVHMEAPWQRVISSGDLLLVVTP